MVNKVVYIYIANTYDLTFSSELPVYGGDAIHDREPTKMLLWGLATGFLTTNSREVVLNALHSFPQVDTGATGS